MSTLHKALRDYLSVRRAMGFELYRPGKALEDFVRFAKTEGATFITTELALRWATLPADAEPATWANRLALVRRFARFCGTIEPRTEIPPDQLLPHRYRRKSPYIYKPQDIRRLLDATQALPSKCGLRPCSFETLFGLLAATGIRIGEALALEDADVDCDDGVLTIRNAKFGKTRYVPIHRSTGQAMGRYRCKRDRYSPNRDTLSFFASEHGLSLSDQAVSRAFRRLSSEIGFRASSDKRMPRVHDLRHTFAVRTLLRWYRTDVDIDAYLPRLATYLGHVHVNDTYWYLSAVPELMRWAVRRVERKGSSQS